MIKLKRAYDAPDEADGLRVLVDRFWPRGMRKDAARIDRWERNLAPSPALCKWFSHDPAKWLEFQSRYRHELSAHTDDLRRLVDEGLEGTVTLLFSARDEEHNQALVLKEVLEAM